MFNYFELLTDACEDASEVMALATDTNALVELGTGAFSTVYAAEGIDTVLKVCTKDDDGWLTFGLYCMKHSNTNKHLPKVYDIHIFDDGTYIALIKRYVDCSPQEQYDEDTPGFMGAALYPVLNITAAFDMFTHEDIDVNSYAEFTSMLMATVASNSLQVPGWLDVELDDVESMIEALYTIWTNFSEDFTFDCHSGNFMLDNNTVIISDPLSYIL